jgi:hypothetical protein
MSITRQSNDIQVFSSVRRAIEGPFNDGLPLLLVSGLLSLTALPEYLGHKLESYPIEHVVLLFSAYIIAYAISLPALQQSAMIALGHDLQHYNLEPKFSIPSALFMGLRRLPTLLGLCCLLGLLVTGGMLLLVLPGIYAVAVTFVASTACVLERFGAVDSIKRSRDLTRGFEWTILGASVVLYIIMRFVGFAAELSASGINNQFVGATIQWFGATLSFAFMMCLQVHLYVQLRHIKEGEINNTFSAHIPAEDKATS